MQSLFNRRYLSIATCLVGLCSTMSILGICQQVSSQVNSQVNATSVSSSVEAGVNSRIGATSVEMAQIGAVRASGLGTLSSSNSSSTGAHTGSSAFSSTKSQSVFSAGMQSRMGKSRWGLARGETEASGSQLSNSSGKHFNSDQSAGNGLGVGQFPDSTREAVAASPFLSGHSLEFFTTGLPLFAPQFDRERHLNPSYAVTGVKLAPRTIFGRHLGFARSLAGGLEPTHNHSVHLQIRSSFMSDPLGADAISDPLKHELGSGLSGNEFK